MNSNNYFIVIIYNFIDYLNYLKNHDYLKLSNNSIVKKSIFHPEFTETC